MSHLGVDVAPHIPILDVFCSHSFFISETFETSFEFGFTLQHSSNNTLPFELFYRRRIESNHVFEQILEY